MNRDEKRPAISAIIATPDNFQTVRQLVRYLSMQTIKDQIELVFIAPFKAELGIVEAELDGFYGFKTLETGPFKSLNHARVKGIMESEAPVVVITEDHCFPAPGWAEALVEAHKGPWAAVGPAIGLANSHCMKSWANYYVQYAPWMRPTEGGVAEDIPGHNSSYKKDILMQYGEELESMMDFEYVLHKDLQKKGYQIYLEAKAEAYHLFMTLNKPFFLEHFSIGQLLAASRARHFNFLKRLFLLITAPLLPLVRTGRIIRQIREQGWQGQLIPGILPWLLSGLTVSATGELMGYAFGRGHSQQRTIDLDFNRDRFISEEEKRRIYSEKLLDFSKLPVAPTFMDTGKNPDSEDLKGV